MRKARSRVPIFGIRKNNAVMSVCEFLMACIIPCILVSPLHGDTRIRERTNAIDIFALRDKEELVLTVGQRLATAAAPRCAKRVPGLGLTLHDLDQYVAPYRHTAAAMFPRTDLPAVLAVAAGGAAAQAGVRSGEAVVAVEDMAVTSAHSGLGRVEAVIAQAEAAATSTGGVRLTLATGGMERTVALTPKPSCAVRFQVRPDRALDARTDGWLIEATTGLIDFAGEPDELAAALAHELAHVILDHRERTRGVPGTQSRAAELEADRLAVRLAADAGFRPGAAVDFWQRMRAHGGGPSGLGRHPADRQRIVAVQAALAELAKEGMPQAR